MKIYILLLITFITMLATETIAQRGDSWVVKLNKQTLLRSPVETSDPVIYISKAALQGNNIITIQYSTADSQNDWKRIFNINDENEESYKEMEMKNQSGSISFSAKDFKKAALTNEPLILYTMSLPKDPSQAALVRVRRFLLCKIHWKN